MTDLNVMGQAYATAAETLCQRILDLIPQDPRILDMESPYDLFDVAGFTCQDLSPTDAMASAAFGKAKRLHREGKMRNPELEPGE